MNIRTAEKLSRLAYEVAEIASRARQEDLRSAYSIEHAATELSEAAAELFRDLEK